MNDTSQYRTAIKVFCAGAPHVTGKERRNCSTQGTVECSSWTVRKQYHEINEELRPKGWRFIKTIGKKKWLCPRCAKFVMNKRLESKKIWG